MENGWKLVGVVQVIGRIRAVHLPIVISRPSICRYSADIRLVLDWAGRALGAGRAYTGWELSSSPRVYINCAPIACTTKGSVWSVDEHLSIFFHVEEKNYLWRKAEQDTSLRRAAFGFVERIPPYYLSGAGRPVVDRLLPNFLICMGRYTTTEYMPMHARCHRNRLNVGTGSAPLLFNVPNT